MKPNIDIELLKTFLSYDKESGHLTWLVRRGKAQKGDIAGCLDGQGYVVVAIMGKLYNAHRIAWAIHYGYWPKQAIDHKNLVKSANWIDNLRLCTTSQNLANTAPWSTNTSGKKGVTWNKKSCKWQAGIRVNGVTKHLGLFADIELAAAAYASASKEAFGNFARTEA